MNTIKMSFDIELSVSDTRALSRHADGYGYTVTMLVKMLLLQFMQREKDHFKELDKLSQLAFDVQNKE